MSNAAAPPRLKKRVQKQETVRKRTEHLSLEVNGWEVNITKEQDGPYDISVTSAFDIKVSYRSRNRCGFHTLRPRSVAELEAFAKDIGLVLARTAEALRAAGITEMRSKYDIENDE